MTATASPIPSSPHELTGRWLESVLGTDEHPVSVDTVTVDPVGTGQTGATYRLTVVYTDPTESSPTTLVVKLPSQDAGVRERVALGYRSEHVFYSRVADTVAVPVPDCLHIDISDDAADFVLVLADLAPAVQGDQIAGCSPTQARAAVAALAGLHGPRWCDPTWLTLEGVVMPVPDAATADGFGEIARIATTTTIERLGASLSDADRATLTESADAITPWLLSDTERFSLLHGDFRLDNLLFHPETDEVTVVDWQTLSVGLPARDLAYFIGTSLDPHTRAEHERDLVCAYHQALSGHGVTGYDAETCWRDYRSGMLAIPLITTLGFAFAAGSDRGDDMFIAMIERGCEAIRELGTLDLIGDRP
ncbi:phosphotransferase family protein [Williamsia maris]|uniref:Kinase, aminoglycoside phosphotransferase (APT) family n=1 Tax=Williamsia maris TaxID=72806 RepID=A0ABT1H8V2_9NOCA|nr:aminoglycoside phosphotransferase family protein [Williamsia maris]MCP2174392.1 putative kinase, aminoglycoside phosphotransferase (APT) family [Williamsia maris]